MKPTTQFEILDRYERLLNAYRSAASERDVALGGLESHATAYGASEVAFRHARGVLDLLRLGWDRALPAGVCARAALESWGWAAWVMAPKQPLERQARWLVLADDESSYYQKIDPAIRRQFNTEHVASFDREVLDHKDHVERVRRDVKAAGLAGVKKPGVQPLFESLNFPNIYPSYKYLSQITHGTRRVLPFVQRVHEGMLVHGDFADEWECSNLVASASTGLMIGANVVLKALGARRGAITSVNEVARGLDTRIKGMEPVAK